MHNLGLIPARGGSKTLPRKNIKLLKGKPLIAYTIEAALESKRLDRVIVSTDDEEISEVALAYGAEVPFLRPTNLASDNSPDHDVIRHAIEYLSQEECLKVDNVIYLRPTTPFKTSLIIDKCIEKLNSDNYSGLRTVTKVDGVYHPFWMFKEHNSQLYPFVDGVDVSKYFQRQLLPSCFRLNGVVDIIRTGEALKAKLYGENVGYLEVDENRSVDIDTEFDFKYCEFLLQELLNG
ncbi:MAG: acylneuraminate cytidylyltransferase family protein [Bacteroidota bacterium]